MEASTSSVDEFEDTFRILVVTDTHLGYKEKDAIRGQDSFNTFEEILEIAQNRHVDFILHGGDLFDHTNPSKYTMNRCIELLRKYTLGDTPIKFEMLGDYKVNYENPNINVAIPLFSIHGNHDDPSGLGGISALDILSNTGLVNYFGKATDFSELKIKPILMRKGNTQLALYGLSHIHDYVLSPLWKQGKVQMGQPEKESGYWFNLMTLHQNRTDRRTNNFVPEEKLSEFLDLVVWGHEHKCRIIPEEVPTCKFRIVQPGSSIATSLSDSESDTKSVALLYVTKSEFKIEPIRLKTVRPFKFCAFNLDDHEERDSLDIGDPVPKVREIVANKIGEMLNEAKKLITDHPNQPKEPLIRLRIDYTNDDHFFNAIRFGQQYSTRVANPTDMVVFKYLVKRKREQNQPIDKKAMDDAFVDKDDNIQFEESVNSYFADPSNADKLKILPARSLSEMLNRLAQHSDHDGAQFIMNFTQEEACKHLNEKMPNIDDIPNVIADFRLGSDKLYSDTIRKMLHDKNSSGATSSNNVEMASAPVNDGTKNSTKNPPST